MSIPIPAVSDKSKAIAIQQTDLIKLSTILFSESNCVWYFARTVEVACEYTVLYSPTEKGYDEDLVIEQFCPSIRKYLYPLPIQNLFELY